MILIESRQALISYQDFNTCYRSRSGRVFEWTYDTTLYDEARMQQMVESFLGLLQACTAHAGARPPPPPSSVYEAHLGSAFPAAAAVRQRMGLWRENVASEVRALTQELEQTSVAPAALLDDVVAGAGAETTAPALRPGLGSGGGGGGTAGQASPAVDGLADGGGGGATECGVRCPACRGVSTRDTWRASFVRASCMLCLGDDELMSIAPCGHGVCAACLGHLQ